MAIKGNETVTRHSVGQSVSWLVRQSVSQAASKSGSQLVSLSVSHPINQLVSRLARPSDFNQKCANLCYMK